MGLLMWSPIQTPRGKGGRGPVEGGGRRGGVGERKDAAGHVNANGVRAGPLFFFSGLSQ